MGYTEGRIEGVDSRIFRVSFSGELGYEIHVPSEYAETVWESLLDAGKKWDIMPYGLEAMTTLRIEKGHVVASELDGRTTAADLGFERMMKKDVEFIGKKLSQRPALTEKGRLRLVGIISKDNCSIPRGAQIVERGNIVPPADTMGHVTSACFSPHLNKEIALGLVKDGDQQFGRVVHATSLLTGRSVPVEIVHHIFFDPAGERARA